ncbi:hypothetical protein RRF57_008642 [Xylaria bambusicola]|uniref:Uncharacterized protein n=1 Tax=Xylaria bambusicola TaxID=326684 RepID=A0AAN7UTS3_9PEZI
MTPWRRTPERHNGEGYFLAEVRTQKVAPCCNNHSDERKKRKCQDESLHPNSKVISATWDTIKNIITLYFRMQRKQNPPC